MLPNTLLKLPQPNRFRVSFYVSPDNVSVLHCTAHDDTDAYKDLSLRRGELILSILDLMSRLHSRVTDQQVMVTKTITRTSELT